MCKTNMYIFIRVEKETCLKFLNNAITCKSIYGQCWKSFFIYKKHIYRYIVEGDIYAWLFKYYLKKKKEDKNFLCVFSLIPIIDKYDKHDK